MEDFRTLVYIGYKPDPDFPWGGYHVTVTGRTKVPLNTMLNIVQKCTSVFPIDPNSGQLGWIPSVENIRGIDRQSDGKFMTFLKCDYFDEFANALRREGEGVVENIKSNWHISMHDDNEEAVKAKVQYWLEEGIPWQVYVIHWNDRTSQAQWFPILSTEESVTTTSTV